MSAEQEFYNRKVRKRIGKKVKELRLSQGLSRQQLTNRSLVYPSKIIEVESGEKPIDIGVLSALLDAMGKRIVIQNHSRT